MIILARRDQERISDAGQAMPFTHADFIGVGLRATALHLTVFLALFSGLYIFCWCMAWVFWRLGFWSWHPGPITTFGLKPQRDKPRK